MRVKICGVTEEGDASFAASHGADYVGIIFATGSKRAVSPTKAKDIVLAARSYGAEPVAVFVDESIEQIISSCALADIRTIQLHKRRKIEEILLLQKHFSLFYAIAVEEDGLSEEIPSGVIPLFDAKNGGSGRPFDWKRFSPPKDRPWFLAGGLNPENVSLAIALLDPYGVDVASGVEYPSSIRKDPLLVEAFIRTAKEAL